MPKRPKKPGVPKASPQTITGWQQIAAFLGHPGVKLALVAGGVRLVAA